MFYGVLALYFAVSAVVVLLSVRFSSGDNLFQKIVAGIFRLSLVFDMSLFMLLCSLKTLSRLLRLGNYETMRLMVAGVFAMSLALSALSFMNYKFLKRTSG